MADGEKTGPNAVWCSNCGYGLSHQPVGPCPRCGNSSRTYGVELNATATGTASMSKTVGKTLSATARGDASMSWTRTREWVQEQWEQHPVWSVVNVVLVVGAPFLGLWVVAVGLVIGLLGSWVSGKAGTLVRSEKTEITRGGDR